MIGRLQGIFGGMAPIAVVLCRVTSAQADPTIDATADTGAPHGNIHVNVLGPLQFGPTLALELGGRHVAGLLRMRWLNAGLLANEILPTKGGDESLAFSYGAAVGARYFTAQEAALNGWTLGAACEYLHVRNEDTTVDREAYVTALLVPQLEGGYRWRFGRFLVGAGVGVGYALVLSRKTEDLSGGLDHFLLPNNAKNEPYAAGALDVGVFF